MEKSLVQRTERRPIWLDSNEAADEAQEAGKTQIIRDHRSNVNPKIVNLFSEQCKTSDESEAENNNVSLGSLVSGPAPPMLTKNS